MGSRVRSTGQNFNKMKICLVIALAGAAYAAEVALDAPEQFIKDKNAKYSQIVPSEELEEVLKKPVDDFSLKADPTLLYGTYGYGLPDSSIYGGYGGYIRHGGFGGQHYYGKRSADAYTYGAYALPTATAQVSPSASLTTLGLADPSIPALGGAYTGAGRYFANSAGSADEAAPAPAVVASPAIGYGYGYGQPYAYGATNIGQVQQGVQALDPVSNVDLSSGTYSYVY